MHTLGRPSRDLSECIVQTNHDPIVDCIALRALAPPHAAQVSPGVARPAPVPPTARAPDPPEISLIVTETQSKMWSEPPEISLNVTETHTETVQNVVKDTAV